MRAHHFRYRRANSAEAIMSSVRGRGRSMSYTAAMEPGRSLMTITRSDRNTASGMLWVMSSTVFFEADPDALQLQVHVLARHRVQRAEGLVHQQHRGVVQQRPADRGALLHAAGQARQGTCFSKPLSPTMSISCAPASARGPWAYGAFRPAAGCFEHRAPGQQHRAALEHDAPRSAARLMGLAPPGSALRINDNLLRMSIEHRSHRGHHWPISTRPSRRAPSEADP